MANYTVTTTTNSGVDATVFTQEDEDGNVTIDSNTVDDGDGVSLTEAVLIANFYIGRADTIGFDSGAVGVHRLTQTLSITDDLTITGGIADNGVLDVIISGDVDANDVMRTDDTATRFDESLLTDARLNEANRSDNILMFEIARSDASGQDPEVSLNQLVITGGLYANDSSSLANIGGAIKNNRSDLTIDTVVLDGNTGWRGAAVSSNGGTLTVENSQITNNVNVPVNGSYGRGALYLNSNDLVTIENSTISYNSREGVRAVAARDQFIIQSTIVQNNTEAAGGNVSGLTVFQQGSPGNYVGQTTLVNSLIADNGNRDVTAFLYGAGTNFLGDGTDGAAVVIGGTVISGDPVLGALTDNGGPTLTHALLAGSSAVNAGDNSEVPSGLNYDQRGDGYSRIVGFTLGTPTVDLGAFEASYDIGTVVTTNADSLTFNGEVSLREAIAYSNATPGTQTITFDSDITQTTILLNGSDLIITDDVVIEGSDWTINASQDSRIFSITSGTTATLQDLTLINGNGEGYGRSGGGAIYTAGDLTIEGSTVSGNDTSAGGGGILAFGGSAKLTIASSSIEDNSANFGGGVYGFNFDGVSLTDSVVAGNDVNVAVGGVLASFGDVEITNSTISGNTDSGLYAYGNNYSVVLLQSTIADNTGPGVELFDSPDTTLTNSILANNATDLDGVVTGTGTNLIEDGSGTVKGGTLLTGDPSLGDLQNNGGPTDTHALLNGSIAIDVGDNSEVPVSLTTDQRGSGYSRIIDANEDGVATVDLGAFEAPVKTNLGTVVNSLEDNENSDAFVTLREAVAYANAVSGTQTITFDASIAGGTITLGGSEIVITSDIVIDGSGEIIDGDDQSRIFSIADGVSAEIDDLVLTGGNGEGDLQTGSGGAIFVAGELTIEQVSVVDNEATIGGGIAAFGHEGLYVTDSLISENSATTRASGVDVRSGGPNEIVDSTISDNTGVGVQVSGTASYLSIVETTIDGNGGRGLRLTGEASAAVTDSTISGNTGFGVYAATSAGTTLSLLGSTIAETDGSGLFVARNATADVTNSTISGNTEHGLYGYESGATISLLQTTITNNDGNGINFFYRTSPPTVTLANSIVADNGVDLDGVVTGVGTNLVEDGSGTVNGGTLLTGDPSLGDLQDNGGPTQTQALQSDSIALDAGDNSVVPDSLTSDQRGSGFDRIIDGDNDSVATVDLGAFESETIIDDDYLSNRNTDGVVIVDGAATTGSIETVGDRDWIRVDLEAGRGYLIDVLGIGDDPLLDPFAALRTRNGTFLAVNNNSGLDQEAQIVYTATTTDSFYVQVYEAGRDATGDYQVTVEEVEPDDFSDDQDTEGVVVVDGDAVLGVIEVDNDTDWFQVDLVAGLTYEIDVIGTGDDALPDPFGRLRDSSETIVASNNNSGVGKASKIIFEASETETHFVEVYEAGRDATGDYEVSVENVTSTSSLAAVAPSTLDLDTLIDQGPVV